MVCSLFVVQFGLLTSGKKADWLRLRFKPWGIKKLDRTILNTTWHLVKFQWFTPVQLQQQCNLTATHHISLSLHHCQRIHCLLIHQHALAIVFTWGCCWIFKGWTWIGWGIGELTAQMVVGTMISTQQQPLPHLINPGLATTGVCHSRLWQSGEATLQQRYL